MSELILTNARIVAGDEVFSGSLTVIDGRIAAMARGHSHLPSAIDCDGDHLLPGLVELHTDNLEKHVTPRPGVRWPAAAAVLAHDAQMAAAGITTVYDAIACGDVIDGSARLTHLTAMVEAIGTTRRQTLLRADHRIHLRCEVSNADVMELASPFFADPLVEIVSLMDHTPGQRQFVKPEKYREYYQGKYRLSDAELEVFTAKRIADQERYSAKHRRQIAEISRQRGFVLASHDDATVDHVDEAERHGIRFAEFPTTLEAAQAAHARGMKVLMGAPNLVRGGSHSGNVSAGTLAEHRCLDVLSSDYVPVSLLHGAFLLADQGYSLPEAVATVTRNPATVAGLADRGVIDAGKRADLIRVKTVDGLPVVRGVWREGDRVALCAAMRPSHYQNSPKKAMACNAAQGLTSAMSFTIANLITVSSAYGMVPLCHLPMWWY